MSTAKAELKQLIDQQPDDATREELLRELVLHAMIERGLADADADAGRTISNDEMRSRIPSWQK